MSHYRQPRNLRDHAVIVIEAEGNYISEVLLASMCLYKFYVLLAIEMTSGIP